MGRALPPGIRARVLQGVLVAVFLTALVGVWGMVARRSAGFAEIDALVSARNLDARWPGYRDELGLESSPVRARLLLARLLVADAADPGRLAKLPARVQILAGAGAGEDLATAQRVAEEVLAERPASWRAMMLVGAARYLAGSRSRDPALLSNRSRWQLPLEEAQALAPGQDEPSSVLAAAALDLWPGLDREARAELLPELRSTFRSPTFFGRWIDRWLTVEPDVERAATIVPDQPWAWDRLRRRAIAARNWPELARIEEWRHRALQRWAVTALAVMGAEIRGGDPQDARTTGESIVAALDPGLEWAGVVDGAVLKMPAGLVSPATQAPARRWLAWALDRAARGLPGLSPQVIGRVHYMVDDLPRAEAAAALLASGHDDEARVLERRFGALNTEAWGPYVVLRARWELEHGRAVEARELLERVHPAWRRLPRTRVLGQRVGEVEPAAGPAPSYPPPAWRTSGSSARLEVLLARSRGLEIELLDVARGGDLVELRLDGVVAVRKALAGPGRLEVPVHLPAGIHEVELRSLAGRDLLPGTLVAEAETS